MTTTNNPPVTHNPVDEYFWRVDQEILANQRRQRDIERQEREALDRKKAHWMKCPKCGSDLAEQNFHGIVVDQCGGCGGAFFDQGELNLLKVRSEGNKWLEHFLTETFKSK